jgi:L-2-hydroxycarboxylate dehydrogenase (NAD+)
MSRTPGLTVSAERARQVCETALKRAGVPFESAAMQADLLVEAELRGRPSHGLMRLDRIIARIGNGVTDPHAKGRRTWRGAAFLEVDGERGLGPVVACAALEALSERVGETGIALAAIANNNHLGMLAWYADRVVRDGRILIAVSTSEALVHPWGGRRALLGTNPVAIGVPASPHAFVLDMATSLVSMGQIHDRALQGRQIPASWALDQAGVPTTDAAAAMKGAIAPFGEAKGYALGLAFELLVVALTASALGRQVCGTLDSTNVCNKGDVFIVIDAGANAGTMHAIGEFLAMIRDEPPADGFDRIAVPGDRSAATRVAQLRDGMSIEATVWGRLLELAGLQ